MIDGTPEPIHDLIRRCTKEQELYPIRFKAQVTKEKSDL
jgi:hypothetical protein